MRGKGVRPLTVGISIACTEGIVLACDSLTTYGRGVPVLAYTNKIHVLDHEGLLSSVAIIGAGATLFIDKFLDRVQRNALEKARERLGNRQLDIIDFCEEVCEPVITALHKEYVIDKARFLEDLVPELSLTLLLAGATSGGELRTYSGWPDGLTERSSQPYATIGSGAAYAELLVRYALKPDQKPDMQTARKIAVYAIKGVELMDFNVGGTVNIAVLHMANGELKVDAYGDTDPGDEAKKAMEEALTQLGSIISHHIEGAHNS